jgi:hypothetical protein
MPKGGISVYFSIKDGATQVLKTIGDQTRVLDKETQQLSQSYDALQAANKPLIQRQKELKTSLEEQGKAVSAAKAEFKAYGDETSQNNLQAAIEEQERLKEALKDVEGQLKSNLSTYNQVKEDIRRSAMGDNGDTTLEDVATGEFSARIGQQLSSALGGAISTAATSALGSEAASVLSDSISGVVSGAMSGAALGLPGIIAGSLVGGISGLISGGTEIYEAQDDAFKEYYNSLYETVSGETSDMISNGSTTAGSREQTRIAFVQRLGGESEADDYLSQVQEMAVNTNYDYDEIVGYTKTLLNSYDPSEVFGVLQTLSDASGGLGLDSSDVDQMIQGLYMLRVNDTATDQYLKYFRTRGVDTSQALADALGVDPSQVSEMVSGGEVSGDAAAQAILDYIDKTFGGLSEAQASTYDAMVDNLSDITTSLDAIGGDAYNEARKEGIQAQMDAYEGALGDAIGELNTIAGQNQAYLENLSEQYTREALSAVLLGQETSGIYNDESKAYLEDLRDQYVQAAEEYADGSQEAGLKMESLKEQAEAVATAAYEASDQYQLLQDTELDEIAAIRDSITATENLTAALNSYQIAQEQSKGQGTGIANFVAENTGESGINKTVTNAYQNGTGVSIAGFYQGNLFSNSHASGLERVPYDNYAAILHEGERVLTANEARQADQSDGAAPVISGNNFYIREDADIDKVASALWEKIQLARMAG